MRVKPPTPDETGRQRPSTATPANRRRRGTGSSRWYDQVDAILELDLAIQVEIERAAGSPTGHEGADAAGELDRLASIGRFSTCIAGLVRDAAATLDRSPGAEPSIRLSELDGHLRTLQVLHDVLCLTARRPMVDRPARRDSRV